MANPGRRPRTDAPGSKAPSTDLVAAPRALAQADRPILHRSDVERALFSLEVVLASVESHASRRARQSLVDAYKQLDRLWQYAEKG